MLSRRSFAKFCGLSTLPLFGLGTEVKSPVSYPDYSAARTITLDSNLLMPEIAQLFTETDYIEFPLDFIGGEGKGDSIRLLPFMIQKTITYDSKYKNRPDVINRTAEILAKDIQKSIEENMLHLLFVSGAESNTIFGYKKTDKLPINLFGCNNVKFIISPETLDERFTCPSPPSEKTICSHLLGKNQSFQNHMADMAGLKFSGDIGIRVRPNRSDNNIVLSQLPHLPPMMGFNTSFEFDSKTCKVTEVKNQKEGKGLISMAYFCAMGVLDHRVIQLLDIET